MLGDDRQQPVVLPEDRVHERVEEQVRTIDAEMCEQMLHATTGTTGERAVAQRLVLGALLADDEDLDLMVAEAPAVEHRAEVPTKLLVARHRHAEAPIVRGLGEQARPAAIFRRARVVVPW